MLPNSAPFPGSMYDEGYSGLTKKTRSAPNRYGAMPSKSHLLCEVDSQRVSEHVRRQTSTSVAQAHLQREERQAREEEDGDDESLEHDLRREIEPSVSQHSSSTEASND